MFLLRILILILVLTSSLLSAQQYLLDTDHYTTEDGLSHNAIHTMTEDRRGLIWMATRYGVNRFDGQEFRVYTKERHGLHANQVGAIYEDGAGMLWFFTGWDEFSSFKSEFAMGYTIFDPLTEMALDPTTYLPPRLKHQLDRITHFYQNVDREIVLLTDQDSTVVFRTINDATYAYADLPAREINDHHEGKGWISSSETLTVYVGGAHYTVNYRTGGARPIQISPPWFQRNLVSFPQRLIDGRTLTTIGQDTTSIGQYLITENTGIKAYDLFGQFPAITSSPAGYPLQIDTTHNLIWLHQDEHIALATPEGGISARAPAPPRFRRISSLVSSSGTLFVSDRREGLRVYRPRHRHFSTHGLEGFSHRDMALDHNDRFYIGLSIGQNNVPPSSGNITLTHNHAVLRSVDSSVWSGASWANFPSQTSATASEYQNRFLVRRYPDGTVRNYLAPEPLVPNIWALWEHPVSRLIYSATQRGYVSITDPITGRSEVIIRPEDGQLQPLTLVYDFTIDATGIIWLSSSTGLYKINGGNHKVIARFAEDEQAPYQLPTSAVHHLYIDAKHRFWLSTGDAGLIHWSPDGQYPMRQYTVTDGLPSMVVHAAYEDAAGNFWLSTEGGISQFNESHNTFINYGLKDGLTDLEFNRIAHYRHTDGSIYFGGLSGITGFNPESFYVPTNLVSDSITLSITDVFQINAKTNLRENTIARVIRDNQIILPPNYARARVRLNDLPRQAAHHVVSYQIDGIHKVPQLVSENEFTLGNLPFGEYNLVLTAQSADGSVLQRKQLEVIVLRPVYLQWWFWVLALGLLGALVYGATYVQSRHLRRLVQDRTLKIEQDKALIERQAQKLKDIDELKSRLFANVSHELRTPLTLILAPLRRLLNQEGLSGKTFTSLRRMLNSGLRLQGLVNDIMDLAKLEEGKLEVYAEPTEIKNLLRRITGQFDSLARQQGLHMTEEHDLPEELVLRVDRKKVETILRNLLINAVKYSGHNGQITVISAYSNGNLNVSVTDTGQGIAPDQLPQIFDRFYQAHHKGEVDQPTGGTGIGLAICQELTQLMGGQITANSEEGIGSRFSFSLPLPAAAPDEEVASLSIVTNLSSGQTTPESVATDNKPTAKEISDLPLQKILLVEDHPELREYLQEILSGNFEVITANNGKIALEYLTQSSNPLPDLVITDLMMPELDGFGLIRHIKADDKLNLLPVIVLSARSAMGDRLGVLRTGVDDYILKPFEETELLQRVHNLLANSAARRSLTTTERDPVLSVYASDKAKNSATAVKLKEDTIVKEAEQYVIANLTDTEFGNEQLAALLFTSSRTLSRKIKAATGMSINKFMLEIRLTEARRLLEQTPRPTLASVAASVGFKKTSYFSSRFRERFGTLPSTYGLN